MWKNKKKFKLIFTVIIFSEKHGREGLTIQASNQSFCIILDKSCKWKPSLKKVEAFEYPVT